MIISIAAAAIASAQPAATAPAPARMPAMEHHAAGKDKAMAKMDCCKDGCACCKHDDAGKTEPAKN